MKDLAVVLFLLSLTVAGATVNFTLYGVHGDSVSLVAGFVCLANTLFQGTLIARSWA